MNKKHAQTLESIFSAPINGNIEWSRIEALLKHRVVDAKTFLESLGIEP